MQWILVLQAYVKLDQTHTYCERQQLTPPDKLWSGILCRVKERCGRLKNAHEWRNMWSKDHLNKRQRKQQGGTPIALHARPWRLTLVSQRSFVLTWKRHAYTYLAFSSRGNNCFAETGCSKGDWHKPTIKRHARFLFAQELFNFKPFCSALTVYIIPHLWDNLAYSCFEEISSE